MDLDAFLPAIVARDTRAFGQWMARAEGRMRESLRSFATVVDVESVLQEALLRVWHVAPRFVPDGRPDGLVRLGIRIARNLAISELRRTRARPVEDDELERVMADDEPSEVSSPDPMLRKVIAECHDKLPEKPRQALDARVRSEGRSEDLDLASQLGMRLNTFLQNFGRARRLLAECLRKHGIALPELET
ncbi:hypothetical protein AKJ09_10047 [Labilithrix luteola]|uniref:RNA polymerase sigma-70 region 2 domain-containing protein n=1 Tax=Labilithrix luteola TaxID=1391654 RepID=A0A0K1QCB1_9BACT|nr:sigma-70 family RNA polymerase sigma factor [Labilithrix luteola]AKV03384.1 hypothetical protein AKJ09_10047 [Labilithrix luteola]